MSTFPDDQDPALDGNDEHDERPTARVRQTRSGDVSSAATRTPPSRTRRAPVRRALDDDVDDVATDWDTGASTSSPAFGAEPAASAPEVAALLRDATRAGAAAAEEGPGTEAVAPVPTSAEEDAEDHFWVGAPTGRSKRQGRVQPRERRYRQTIQRVDLWSVAKLSLCFYVSCMFVTIIALVALWTVADAAGIVDNVEQFLGDLLSSDDFRFVSGEVLRGAALIAVVVVALQVVVTVIAASFYNIFSELFGGLEITIREEESHPQG